MEVYLSIYDLLLPPDTKELGEQNFFFFLNFFFFCINNKFTNQQK